MADVPIRALLRNPQVVVIALAAMLANSDYAFLEPTLGDHVADNGLAKSPDSIGMLFSVSSITYTLSCPIVGILASRERCGPRPIIVSGQLLQLFGFLIIGPRQLAHTQFPQLPHPIFQFFTLSPFFPCITARCFNGERSEWGKRLLRSLSLVWASPCR